MAKGKLATAAHLLKRTAQEWSADKATTHAAALSYYTVFSVAPLIVIAVAVAGFIFGDQAAAGRIQTQLQGLVGASGAKVIESMVANAHRPGAGVLASAVGVLVLLFGASGVFVQLQDSLNNIWKTKPPEKLGGLLNTLRTRFLSFTMVLGIGFLLLVSLILSAALAAVGSYLNRLIPGWELTAHLINLGISFAVVTLLFAMIYKVLPDCTVRWGDVWLGAAVTSLLFGLGKFAIGLYLGKSSVGSTYGAAGSVAIVLIWVYYSAQILLFGAEFTQVFARHHGSRVEPKVPRGSRPAGHQPRLPRRPEGRTGEPPTLHS